MALWGNKDLVYDYSTITVSGTTVTGSGTTFTAAGIKAGNVLSVGAGATGGYAVVKSVDSNTQITLSSTDSLIGSASVGVTYAISGEPLYTVVDPVYIGPETKTTSEAAKAGYTKEITTAVYGVDEIEIGVANAASGEARKYAPPHTGWVGITTYLDMHGNLRVKHDVLVAGGIVTTSDASDNAYFPNA